MSTIPVRFMGLRLMAGAFAVLLGFLLSAGSAVQAAEPAAAVERLVITAERRTEDLQTSAVSATVLTGQDLIDKSVFGLTALQYAAPSVLIEDLGSANVFNIRGIGRSKVDVEIPSGVVIYRDGAPTLTGYFQNEPYFDMAGIEVLRGPQGTFVGKSAAGGALFIRTNNPELGKLGGNVEIGGGNHEQAEITGAVNVPVTDTVAMRFAGTHFQRNDFYENLSGPYTGNPGERDNTAVRASLLWEPSDALDLILKTDVADLDFGGNVTTSYGHDLFENIAQNSNFKYTDKSQRTVLDVKYDVGDGIRLSSISGYQKVRTVNNLDLNATDPLPYRFQSRGEIKIYSQEFNLISPEDQKINWVLGAFYFKQEFDIPAYPDSGFWFTGGPFQGPYPWLQTPWQQNQEDYAGFAHAGYNFTDAIELELGIRYSKYEMDQFTAFTFGFGQAAPTIPFGGPAGGISQDLDESSVDGMVSLNWTMNDRNFIYGLISRGHIVSGINIFPPYRPYDEVEVINYETGWKATFAEDRVTSQLTLYYETFDNYQADFANAVNGVPVNSSTVRNAEDESTIWGVEWSAQAAFGELHIDLAAAYLDSELGSFNNVVDPFRTAPNNVVDLSGTKSPYAPEWTGNIGVEYGFHLTGDMTLTPRIDYAYIDETQAGLWDSPRITLESRKLTNLQVRLDAGRWWANAWMTNATDEQYAGGIQNNASLFYAAPPRMYGLRIGMSLGD